MRERLSLCSCWKDCAPSFSAPHRRSHSLPAFHFSRRKKNVNSQIPASSANTARQIYVLAFLLMSLLMIADSRLIFKGVSNCCLKRILSAPRWFLRDGRLQRPSVRWGWDTSCPPYLNLSRTCPRVLKPHRLAMTVKCFHARKEADREQGQMGKSL